MYPEPLRILHELEKDAQELRLSHSRCAGEHCLNLYSQTPWESQHITRLYWFLNKAENGVSCRVLECSHDHKHIMSIKVCVEEKECLEAHCNDHHLRARPYED